MTTTTKTNDGRTINGRTLKTDNCVGCGTRLQMWVLDGDGLCCSDCSDGRDRDQNGWSPSNSVG